MKEGYRISVYWEADWKSIVLSLKQWQQIQSGQELRISGKGYSYEGERFQDDWHFNHDGPGTLIVWYDDGGVGWDGRLSDAEVEPPRSY